MGRERGPRRAHHGRKSEAVTARRRLRRGRRGRWSAGLLRAAVAAGTRRKWSGGSRGHARGGLGCLLTRPRGARTLPRRASWRRFRLDRERALDAGGWGRRRQVGPGRQRLGAAVAWCGRRRGARLLGWARCWAGPRWNGRREEKGKASGPRGNLG